MGLCFIFAFSLFASDRNIRTIRSSEDKIKLNFINGSQSKVLRWRSFCFASVNPLNERLTLTRRDKPNVVYTTWVSGACDRVFGMMWKFSLANSKRFNFARLHCVIWWNFDPPPPFLFHLNSFFCCQQKSTILMFSLELQIKWKLTFEWSFHLFCHCSCAAKGVIRNYGLLISPSSIS